MERLVADIWCEVLGLPRVSVRANFFDLGGHSILIQMVHDRLARCLPTSPSVVDLFTYPTVRALARHLGGHGSADLGPSAGRTAERVSRRAVQGTNGRAVEAAGGLARLGRQRTRRVPPSPAGPAAEVAIGGDGHE